MENVPGMKWLMGKLGYGGEEEGNAKSSGNDGEYKTEYDKQVEAD